MILAGSGTDDTPKSPLKFAAPGVVTLTVRTSFNANGTDEIVVLPVAVAVPNQLPKLLSSLLLQPEPTPFAVHDSTAGPVVGPLVSNAVLVGEIYPWPVTVPNDVGNGLFAVTDSVMLTGPVGRK